VVQAKPLQSWSLLGLPLLVLNHQMMLVWAAVGVWVVV
jgi:hypothetical protein